MWHSMELANNDLPCLLKNLMARFIGLNVFKKMTLYD